MPNTIENPADLALAPFVEHHPQKRLVVFPLDKINAVRFGRTVVEHHALTHPFQMAAFRHSLNPHLVHLGDFR